jgi:flavin reductase (DIM6/NTAB) family NADH-FMN oxidoreductase RutF
MEESNPNKHLIAALGRIPSGLFVITARQGEAETGMLASWIQQCSFDPPLITVALKQGREITAWLSEGAPFTVNILDESQTDMIIHFGRGFSLKEQAFDGLEIDRPNSAPPVLAEALAYLECRVTARYRTGDHDLYVGRVVAGGLRSEGHPMVHIRKSGHHY